MLYTDLVYQPMLELLSYLRANGFKTFIVSGGGVEFMRNFAEKSYGIPPRQVIGSSGVAEYQMWDASPVLVKMPKVLFVDDGPGKPEGINTFIGRRPIFAFGNSDGDKEMLEWTGAGEGLRFMGLVYHTDAEREYAYGPAGASTPRSAPSQGADGRGDGKRLGHGRHEERLEDHLPAGEGAIGFREKSFRVMPGQSPGHPRISIVQQDVDGRLKAGHDVASWILSRPISSCSGRRGRRTTAGS